MSWGWTDKSCQGQSSINQGAFCSIRRKDNPRERGRPARTLILQTASHPRVTLLQAAPNPPSAGPVPFNQVLCGRDARAPGWVLTRFPLPLCCHPKLISDSDFRK